jgi:hypothetical protein
MDLLRELEQLPEPTSGERGEVAFSLVPDDASVGRAVEFQERAKALLRELRPSLLPAYADAANACLTRERTKRREQAEADEIATDAIKLKHFTEWSNRRPALWVEASLEGLAAARNRLGE